MGQGIEMMMQVSLSQTWRFLTQITSKETALQSGVPLTIDLGNRRLGVQLGDSLHKLLRKPLLKEEGSTLGVAKALRGLLSSFAQTGPSTSTAGDPLPPSELGQTTSSVKPSWTPPAQR